MYIYLFFFFNFYIHYIYFLVSTFQTEFYISGIAPLDHQLVLLGVPKELDKNNKSLRPQLYIIEYKDNDYTDICTDSLSLRGNIKYLYVNVS